MQPLEFMLHRCSSAGMNVLGPNRGAPDSAPKKTLSSAPNKPGPVKSNWGLDLGPFYFEAGLAVGSPPTPSFKEDHFRPNL